MSRDSIRCRFTLALILLALLLCAAARAEEARRDVALLVVWTDDTGAEQSVTLEKPDDGESVQYTVPMAAFPSDAVQVFRASGPDTERVWLAVTALPLESGAEDLRLYRRQERKSLFACPAAVRHRCQPVYYNRSTQRHRRFYLPPRSLRRS